MPYSVQATSDFKTLTVADHLKDPLLVGERLLSSLDQLFVADQILRSAGNPSGGSMVYYESTPLFANDSSEYVEEYGEIPVTTGQDGIPKAVRVRKRGLGVRISREMRDRNSVDLLNKQISQTRNTFVQDYDNAFWTTILGATSVGMHTRAAIGSWSGGTSKVRKDILLAVKDVTDEKMGFEPDTLVLNPTNMIDLMTNAEFTSVYQGNAADQNPLLAGNLNFGFAGLKVLKSYGIAAGNALVVESKTFGGYADERPLDATPLYEERKSAETWRADLIRSTALFVDSPKAGTLINGI
jgi:hypothetical protein